MRGSRGGDGYVHWGLGLEGLRMLMDGVGGGSVRPKVRRVHLVVGSGAEVQYHDGCVGESTHVAAGSARGWSFFLR